MKKQALAGIAERLYVVDQRTFQDIADELEVSERSVRTWAQEGSWATKRAALVSERTSLEQDLVGFARRLTKIIDIDLERLANSDATDPERDQRIESRINALTRLLGRLPQTREYEKTVRQDQQSTAKASATPTSRDELVAKVNEILGA